MEIISSRTCFRCAIALPASSEFFYRDKARPLGLSYECKQCLSARKAGRDRRTDRWANHTPEQRAKVKERQYRYNRSEKARAVFLASAYRQIDSGKGHENDVTYEFMRDVIFKSKCVYCGTTQQLGCDRLDNAKGHTVENVVPACADCNIVRGSRFTFDEMLIVGKAISHIRALRDISATATENEDRP